MRSWSPKGRLVAAGVVVGAVVALVLVIGGGSDGPAHEVATVRGPAGPSPIEQDYLRDLRGGTRQVSAGLDDETLIAAGDVVCDYLDEYVEISSEELDLAAYKANNSFGYLPGDTPPSSFDGLQVVVWGIEYFCPEWRGARDSLLGPPELLG